MGLLVSSGFIGAKAGHSDQRFCRWKLLFYQQPCAKAKEFGFTNSRVQKLKNSAKPNSGTVCRIFYGGILFWLWESKGNCAFKKAGKIQGRGETNAFDAMVSPLPIYLPETLQFRAAPKNAVHFLYGAVLHRPGGTPGPPYAVPSLFEIGILITGFSESGIRGFGLRLLISQGFLGAKAGFVEGCNLWNVLYNPEAYVW